MRGDGEEAGGEMELVKFGPTIKQTTPLESYKINKDKLLLDSGSSGIKQFF